MPESVPTSWREQLPKHLSYPLSATEVRHAFSDMPNDRQPTVDFRTSVLSTVQYQQLLTTQSPLPAVAGVFRNWAAWRRAADKPRARTGGEPENAEWRIEVYAGPREHRHHVHDVLLREGLGVVRNWITAARPDVWYEYPHKWWDDKRIDLSVNPLTDEVVVTEHE